MQKLKLLLDKKKNQVGTSFSRAQIEQKRIEVYKETQEKAEQQKQKKLEQKLKYIDQFCEPKKKTKAQNILQQGVPIVIYAKQQKQIQKDKDKEQKEDQDQNQQRSDKQQLKGEKQGQQQLKENQQKPVNEEILNKKIQDQKQYEQLQGRFRQLLIQPKLLEQHTYRAKKLKMIQAQKEKQVLLADKCDQILLWCKKILRVWIQTLQLKYNTQEAKKSRSSQDAFNLYKETLNHLQPLFIVLRARNGDLDMIDSIYHILNCSLLRDYRQANDRYIEMSIGNAPWPVGAIMLGITVRRNTPRLAHVLKDPVSRRWTQAIKRLLTVSQELYPNSDNTKMVLYSVASIFGQ